MGVVLYNVWDWFQHSTVLMWSRWVFFYEKQKPQRALRPRQGPACSLRGQPWRIRSEGLISLLIIEYIISDICNSWPPASALKLDGPFYKHIPAYLWPCVPPVPPLCLIYTEGDRNRFQTTTPPKVAHPKRIKHTCAGLICIYWWNKLHKDRFSSDFFENYTIMQNSAVMANGFFMGTVWEKEIAGSLKKEQRGLVEL